MPEGTGLDVHSRDWTCLDCNLVYCYDEDATKYDLPEFCPECGDHRGWYNKKTGKRPA